MSFGGVRCGKKVLNWNVISFPSMKTISHLILVFTLLVIAASCKKDDNEDSISLGLLKIDAAPGKGFLWPYYLNIHNTSKSTTLLVLPNNTGYPSNDQTVHDKAAKDLAEWGYNFAKELNIPLLVPTFPRPEGEVSDYSIAEVYTQALDRETLETSRSGIQRIDLQLIAMIDDAIERLSQEGIDVDSKIFIMGFSASGMFTNRFTLLHPDRVKAAAIGSPGGWPIAPIDKWEGESLRYHVGVSDVQQLTGNPFNLDLFKTIPLFFFMGDQDINDSVPFGDSYVQEDRDLVNRLFGTTPVLRWPKAEQIYEYVGCNSQFVLYPGAGHEITSAMAKDLKDFFQEYR